MTRNRKTLIRFPNLPYLGMVCAAFVFIACIDINHVDVLTKEVDHSTNPVWQIGIDTLPPPPPPEPPLNGNYLFEVEVIEGCEEYLHDIKQRQLCNRQQMVKLIYQNLVVPKKDDNCDTTLTVVAQFTVEKNKPISNIKLVREEDEVLNKAVIQAIEKLSEKIHWKKGERGRFRLDKVTYTLPIKISY